MSQEATINEMSFTNLEKENNDLRKQLELKDQEIQLLKEELKKKHDKYLSEL